MTIGATKVIISGGEPTLHPEFPALVRYAKELVKMYWNANRTDEGWAREFAAIQEITRTKDCQEGIRAFLGKRDADYRGPHYEAWPFGDPNGG